MIVTENEDNSSFASFFSLPLHSTTSGSIPFGGGIDTLTLNLPKNNCSLLKLQNRPIV